MHMHSAHKHTYINIHMHIHTDMDVVKPIVPHKRTKGVCLAVCVCVWVRVRDSTERYVCKLSSPENRESLAPRDVSKMEHGSTTLRGSPSAERAPGSHREEERENGRAGE